MSDTVTSGIRVHVAPQFWEERSMPEKSQWAFSYTVTITNEGASPATLRRRHWVITDATGHVEEVRGEGVVGKQPRLEAGASFEYTSYAVLRTPFGSMRGEYVFERTDGSTFESAIGEFALTQPHALH
ncbi:MAG: Co2+/Mg2+ efflux protein ApaG [Archangium sp.]|nr:Co2+/Mg2+ efflux protein ApaG [Archangium sp.]